MDDGGDNAFRFSIPPIDMPPSPESQHEAFTDIACRLVICLSIADKEKIDPAYILAHCDRICDVYTCAGFNLFSEFKHELRTNLRNALRRARRAFLKHGFMCPRSEYPEFLRILKETGWHTGHTDAQEDYDAVVAELVRRRRSLAASPGLERGSSLNAAGGGNGLRDNADGPISALGLGGG
jgi:hypothetical protein